MSAAVDQDADSEEYGKFDSLKQYPFLTFSYESVVLNLIHF